VAAEGNMILPGSHDDWLYWNQGCDIHAITEVLALYKSADPVLHFKNSRFVATPYGLPGGIATADSRLFRNRILYSRGCRRRAGDFVARGKQCFHHQRGAHLVQ